MNIIRDNNLDRIFGRLTLDVMSYGDKVSGTRELLHKTIELTDPTNNIIGNVGRGLSPYYLAGELVWYLKGTNSLRQIGYYSKFWNKISDDGLTCRSAYGHRLFNDDWIDSVGTGVGFNQWEKAKKMLKENPGTRQCILHLNLPHNKETKDEICTLNLQFIVRDGKLNMMTTMRSNDVNLGFSFDVYMFTMFQQIMALELDLELGTYYHTANSMHIYERHYDLSEGVIENVGKGYIKKCTPITKEFIKNIDNLIEFEADVRLNGPRNVYGNYDSYTKTLMHTLNIHTMKKRGYNVDAIGTYFKTNLNEINNEFAQLIARDLDKMEEKQNG